VTTVLTALLLAIMALATLWVGTFGAAGAAIAAHRGHDRIRGFFVGAFLGPIGLIWMSSRKRSLTTDAPAPTTSAASTPALDSFGAAPTSGNIADINI